MIATPVALPPDFNGNDYVTVAQARELLKNPATGRPMPKATMSGLISRGVFQTVDSPLDGRVKLILRRDVERVASVPRASFHKAGALVAVGA